MCFGALIHEPRRGLGRRASPLLGNGVPNPQENKAKTSHICSAWGAVFLICIPGPIDRHIRQSHAAQKTLISETNLNDEGRRRHGTRATLSVAWESHLAECARSGNDDKGKIPASCSNSRHPCFYSAPSSMPVQAFASYDGTSSARPSMF